MHIVRQYHRLLINITNTIIFEAENHSMINSAAYCRWESLTPNIEHMNCNEAVCKIWQMQMINSVLLLHKQQQVIHLVPLHNVLLQCILSCCAYLSARATSAIIFSCPDFKDLVSLLQVLPFLVCLWSLSLLA